MIYNSWTMQPDILMRLSSVLHGCWCCIEIFIGFPCIFNLKLCPWRGMAYHGGMCYMDGMCFVMLTPMLYISVCMKICGVICGKGFAHVAMMSSIALDYVYRTYSACWKVYGTTHKRHYQFSNFHGACWKEV